MTQVKTKFKKAIDNKRINRGIIRLDEVPEPEFDMTYRKVTPELIKYLTSQARKSPELKYYIHFLKNYLDISKCSFFENYSMKNGYLIELHHYPFSLFDICEAVASKKLSENGYYETFMVLEEVVLLHYQFIVGLIPLNPTAHKLAHVNELEIHPDMIVGEWREFYTLYAPFLSQTAVRKYEELIEIEKTTKEPRFPVILELNPLEIDVKGIKKVINENELNTLMIETKIKELNKISS
jgi:hypothetical protein